MVKLDDSLGNESRLSSQARLIERDIFQHDVVMGEQLLPSIQQCLKAFDSVAWE